MLSLLQSRFAFALDGMTDDVSAALQLIRPAQDAKFGDYQANMAMSLGKSLKKNPREVAAEIVARLKIDDICEPPEIAGPGFINLRFKNEALAQRLENIVCDTERLGVTQTSEPKTIVIDYSAPNIAKAMHVGHIRSTVIGNALARMLRFRGHNVITDNHIGDWGTQFGMMIYGYRNWLGATAYAENPSAELTRLYRLVREKIDVEKDSVVAAAVLEETAKLHHNDADNVALWKSIVESCRRDIDRIYQRLAITFDYTLGESFYNAALPELVTRLLATGVARESDGAVAIFFGDGDEETPMLVRKKDGAFLYGTTDLATIEYRLREWRPDAILYVVDFRQSLHFQHLFAAAQKIGVNDCELVHLKFGTVLGDDGKPFKTRSGDAVGLESLLDEAEERALSVVAESENVKSMSDDGKREIARRVGLGALVYADLAQNRESDYVFSYDKMLSMNGNTATYMQYAYARIRSIFSRGEVDADALRSSGARIVFTQTEERSLALALLQFGDAIDAALNDYRPHILTAYLFELANRYSSFFEKCPVLKAESDAVRTSRLILCDLTARTLQKGLDLLGIKTVERM
ncbi:MAG: arginine--tRNA ligase [Thermoguttaceae bacterium]